MLKENPQLFFSKLDKDAEKEFTNLLEFIIFKYDIKITSVSEKSKNEKPLKKIPNFINNPIQCINFITYSRDELYER